MLHRIERILRKTLEYCAECHFSTVAMGDFRQSSVGTSALQVAEMRGFPHELTSILIPQSGL